MKASSEYTTPELEVLALSAETVFSGSGSLECAPADTSGEGCPTFCLHDGQ